MTLLRLSHLYACGRGGAPPAARYDSSSCRLAPIRPPRWAAISAPGARFGSAQRHAALTSPDINLSTAGKIPPLAGGASIGFVADQCCACLPSLCRLLQVSMTSGCHLGLELRALRSSALAVALQSSSARHLLSSKAEIAAGRLFALSSARKSLPSAWRIARPPDQYSA